MKIETKAVHAGDRKADPARRGSFVPVTTPIFTASSYVYESTDKLDRVMGQEEPGYCYGRYDNPTLAALEELITELEGGAGSLACASGMLAIQTALLTALTDRPKRVLASNALYGATVSMLTKVLEPLGVDAEFVDVCDVAAVEQKLAAMRPGCVIMETISNPLLRVGPIDRIAALCRSAKAALVVDNTFATPLLVRPLQLGANLVVHSVTKFLAGHGDVLGGVVTADADHFPILRTLNRTSGVGLGPFEAYLTMRGIKTFVLRMERQCANACRIASWLGGHPGIARVYYPADPGHPDSETIGRLLPKGLHGAIVTFDLKDAGKAEVFGFMDRLKLIVKGTSLGDVHSLMLYPAIASHRDLAPKQRERMGITDGTLRLCAGIEAVDDLIADLDQALRPA
ncbi:MAG TPA: PLP-dependent aspartate aminotransferase family protein [Bryobacteraceae bacterium]|nr:PLP-dependent aspartate aminotransferase family protein [Bryobacteraceae bacterium]